MTYRTFGSGLGVFHCAQSHHSLAADHGTGGGGPGHHSALLLNTGDSEDIKIVASSGKEEKMPPLHWLKTLFALKLSIY